MFSADVFDAGILELAEKMDQSPAVGVNGNFKFRRKL